MRFEIVGAGAVELAGLDSDSLVMRLPPMNTKTLTRMSATAAHRSMIRSDRLIAMKCLHSGPMGTVTVREYTKHLVNRTILNTAERIANVRRQRSCGVVCVFQIPPFGRNDTWQAGGTGVRRASYRRREIGAWGAAV